MKNPLLLLSDEPLAELLKGLLHARTSFGAALRIVDQEAMPVMLLTAPVKYEVVNRRSVLNKVCLVPDQDEAQLLVYASFTQLLQPEFEIFQLKTNPV